MYVGFEKGDPIATRYYSESERASEIFVSSDDLPTTRVNLSDLEQIHSMMTEKEEVIVPGDENQEVLRKKYYPLLRSILLGIQKQNIDNSLILCYRSMKTGHSPASFVESLFPTHSEEYREAYIQIMLECDKYFGRCDEGNWIDYAKYLYLLWKNNHCYSQKKDKRTKNAPSDGWLFGADEVKGMWLGLMDKTMLNDFTSMTNEAIYLGEYNFTEELDYSNTVLLFEPLIELHIFWEREDFVWKNQYFIRPDVVVKNVNTGKINVIDYKTGKQLKDRDHLSDVEIAQQVLTSIGCSVVLSDEKFSTFLNNFSLVHFEDQTDTLLWNLKRWKGETFRKRGNLFFPVGNYFIKNDNVCGSFDARNWYRGDKNRGIKVFEVSPGCYHENVAKLAELSQFAVENKEEYLHHRRIKKRERWFSIPVFPSKNIVFQRTLLGYVPY